MALQKSLLQKIEGLKNLPTLPHILLRLIETCDSDSGSLKGVSEIVEKDPALCIKILKLVNSAFFSLPCKVESIDQAVALVGTNAVKNMAICASVYEAFQNTSGNDLLNLKRFWWHSLKSSVLARLIARKIKYAHPDEAFLSALLHDIGKLVLLTNFPEQYENILKDHNDREDSPLEAENQLGANHAEVGAYLLDRWNMQPFMADSVLYHHEPEERIFAALPMVQIVYVANALAKELPEEVEKGVQTAEKIFNLTEPEVGESLRQSEEEAKEIAHSLGIEIEQAESSKITITDKDLKKQKDLTHKIRNISLLLGTLNNLLVADGLDAILKVIKQGFRILFNIENVLFFLFDQDKNSLIGLKGSEDKERTEIDGLTIPLRVEDSLLISSFKHCTSLNSFDRSTEDPSTILDEQILRLLGKEGIFCLPISAKKECEGVIVIGIDRNELSLLSEQKDLLRMFANQSATAFQMERLRKDRLKTIQSERFMASLAIAKKVHHEVNNPLGIIKNYLKILGSKLSQMDIAQDEIRIIGEEIDRVSQILRGLSTLSEEGIREWIPVDVNSLLLDLSKITKDSLLKNANISLHLDLDEALPKITGDKNSLKQVFINLVKNAAEAITDGGNIYISSKYLTNPHGKGFRLEGEPHSEYAEITIIDDGSGIPDEMKPRLFEPFVSSKEGNHTGLGLSIAQNIIKSFGGSILCENSIGKGTVFKIELPVAENET